MNLTRPTKFAALAAAVLIAFPAFAADAAAPSTAAPAATTPTAPPNAAKKAKAPPRPFAAVPSPARTQDNVEFVIGPDYTAAPELTARDDVPKGKVVEFTMNSEDSKFYPGIARGQTGVVPYKRLVKVYIPHQYVAGTALPFMVGQDGGYSGFLPTILDNMIHDKRLPVMAAVMIANGGGDSKGSERGLEYDTVSGLYATFVESEVLPRITKEFGVNLTKDPEGRGTLGGSSGGAAAFTMAWFRPDLYHRVLTYSGTYVAQESPTNPASPRGAWEYHAKFIPESDRKPLRIWLHVSEQDNGATSSEESFHNWVMANQRMAAVLKAKGYPYRYVFAEAAGHTDNRVTRQTLPGALEWLWQGYTPKG